MQAREQITTGFKSTAGLIARRLFLDRKAEFWLGELGSARSLAELRARVVDVIDETRDTKTFVLEPNRRWRGHRAGQYLTLDVEIDGVRVRRCYSISSAPSAEHVAITVKRVPGGRVSGWLHDRLLPGHVLKIGDAAGQFVLPAAAPPRLLLLSGGSGVTPVMSILRDLAGRDALRDVVFVHHARSRDDVAFRAELAVLAARHPGLRLFFCLDDAARAPIGFDEQQLAQLVPDFAERATFLCGPPGMMARVEQMWAAAGLGAQLTQERFVAAGSPAAAPGPRLAATDQSVQVRLESSARSFATRGPGSLLEQLERAGERPAFGCRIGVCHTCKCTKRSGTVQNLLTGAVSSEPDEEIQLCISVPCSDIELGI